MHAGPCARAAYSYRPVAARAPARCEHDGSRRAVRGRSAAGAQAERLACLAVRAGALGPWW
jgi:hypothetical protein